MNPHGTLETGTTRRVCELSNGEYTVQLTAAGTGGSSWQDLALTAWARDPVEDMGGFFLYLRDHDSGATWSAGQRPVRRRPDRYEAFWNHERFTIERLDVGIAARLEVVVAPDAPVEIRRLTLENRSRRPRLIEVTSYAEVVLQDAAAFFAHPEFSRLFIQTEYQDGVLLAHRRPRGPGERTPWLWHALADAGALEHETDRRRFIGRGRHLSSPRALADGPLSGTTGNVLDPILSLRRLVELDTGGTASVSFLLGVAPDRAAALEAAERWTASHEATRAIDGTSSTPAEHVTLETKSRAIPARGGRPEKALKPLFKEPLRHFNGIGGFNADGNEYVIRLLHHEHQGLALPPRPWINVLANEHFGCLVSETGAGATWCGNSREHRLTPWSNDPLLDPHGEAFYLVDRDTGEAWSPLAGPRPAAANYEMRHGFGYSRCRHLSHGLEQETCVFVTRHDPVKVVWMRIRNMDPARKLSWIGYQRLVLGARAELEARNITTEIDARERLMLARNPSAGEFAGRVAFAAPVLAADAAVRFTCDREAFLGADGSVREPEALRSGVTEGHDGAGFDPCFAQELELTVPAGAVVECAILLGEGADAAEARRLVARYREPHAIEHALESVQAFWSELLSRVHIQTPCSALDVLVNGWVGYQALACRMWGRTAFQQSGGAFGFRDQLQDAAAMAWFEPNLLREQIRLHAAHQFVEGDVLHWWHPEARGLRTRFADDLLWLPWAVAAHVAATGDRELLDEEVGFVAQSSTMSVPSASRSSTQEVFPP